MTIDAFLALLDSVGSTKRGWKARCPAHADRRPSLAVAEGERGLLVKCWVGCAPEAICTALGLHLSDLFYEQQFDARSWPAAKQARARERADRDAIHSLIGLFIDRERDAERLIRSARGLDISDWDADRLHENLEALADAYEVLEKEAHGSPAGV